MERKDSFGVSGPQFGLQSMRDRNKVIFIAHRQKRATTHKVTQKGDFFQFLLPKYHQYFKANNYVNLSTTIVNVYMYFVI